MRTDDATGEPIGSKMRRYLPRTGLALALLALITEGLAGFGTRWGAWRYTTGLAMFGAGGIAGAIASLVSLVGGIFSGPRRSAYRMAAAGIVIGLGATGILWSWSRTAGEMPKIHDISTDTLNPPRFVAVIPFRAKAENPAEYGGAEVAGKQALAYPDIQPLIVAMKPDAVFAKAVTVGRDMGWDIVKSNLQEGRIEATATTFWFGFKDDVVVRITAVPEGSRIDVRSASRVGLSDLGTNAKRIRVFLQKMKS